MTSGTRAGTCADPLPADEATVVHSSAEHLLFEKRANLFRQVAGQVFPAIISGMNHAHMTCTIEDSNGRHTADTYAARDLALVECGWDIPASVLDERSHSFDRIVSQSWVDGPENHSWIARIPATQIAYPGILCHARATPRRPEREDLWSARQCERPYWWSSSVRPPCRSSPPRARTPACHRAAPGRRLPRRGSDPRTVEAVGRCGPTAPEKTPHRQKRQAGFSRRPSSARSSPPAGQTPTRRAATEPIRRASLSSCFHLACSVADVITRGQSPRHCVRLKAWRS